MLPFGLYLFALEKLQPKNEKKTQIICIKTLRDIFSKKGTLNT
jgi:hypothetical protein